MLCRAKILRLKQHHKGQHGPHRRPLLQSSSSVVEEAVSGGGGGGGGDGRGGGGVGVGHGVPQSVSNYSITRLSQSSSNHSFASGNEPLLARGLFKYYISKEVGGWGQKMAIFADLQYYLC